MGFLRRLLARLFRKRPRSGGVRPLGANALLVSIADRSYWVQTQVREGEPAEYRVWTSDVRDLTDAATVIAAPPAPADAAMAVRQRLEAHFSHAKVRVTYL